MVFTFFLAPLLTGREGALCNDAFTSFTHHSTKYRECDPPRPRQRWRFRPSFLPPVRLPALADGLSPPSVQPATTRYMRQLNMGGMNGV